MAKQLSSVILAGDIGGTKSVVGLFEDLGSGLVCRVRRRFSSQKYGSVEEILSEFLSEHGETVVAMSCFGVAGPVIDGAAEISNLGWTVGESALEDMLRCRRVRLINDMEAMAYGVPCLGADQLAELQQGTERAGNVAVIAAGTGLGEAILIRDGDRLVAVAGEGGHTDFAPRNEEQDGLLRWLRSELGGRVSLERILTGAGLARLYRYLVESREGTMCDELAARFETEDPAAVISELGLSGQDPDCIGALELFAAIYGAEAGDLALQYLAHGGVVLGGGIAPKILPVLASEAFRGAFGDKGRYRGLMTRIPVRVALDADAALLGAAAVARVG